MLTKQMPIMTQRHINARRTWVLGNKKMRRNPSSNAAVAALHRRGYNKGDIRCSACRKWINPQKPEEAREITILPSGRRVHTRAFCDSDRRGGALFTMYPRHSPARRKRMDEVFRY